MRSSTNISRVGLSFLFAAGLLLGAGGSAAQGQSCPITLPASPGNDLSAYVTGYPGYNTRLTIQQQLASFFLVDITNTVAGTNYPNPPLPYGRYAAWCVDEQDSISPVSITVPGTLYTGALFSTCDPSLNAELPPGHPNTIVPPANWQMVNYILNHHTYNSTNAFYWDIQAAINTLVGSGVGSAGCSNILTTPIQDGTCGFPTFHPDVVFALLSAATNFAPDWTPQCGDVYGVVYVTPLDTFANQFLLIAVPVCPGSIGVTKEVACLQPLNECGAFGSIATGYLGTNAPGFCYEITITNSGVIPLTNIVVTDNLLGTLTAQFTNFLAPGAISTGFFKMAFATNATNTVTVTGEAFLAHSVTNGDTVIANGTPFSASAQAVALVQPASLACSLTLSSPLDVSNGINPNAVYLPSATIYSTPPVVTFSVTVYNTSATATVTNVTLTSDALTGLGCTMPPPFTLLPGKSATFTAFCAEPVACPGLTLSINANGQVMSGGGACGVYDITSTNIIGVTTGCMGSISCVPPSTGGGCSGGTATLSGHVYLHCDGTTPVLITDNPLSGLTVNLLNATSNVLATTTTDGSGLYNFTGMAAGTYIVQVTPPANYVQTFPNGSSTSQVQLTAAACDTLVQDFGYSDQSPVTVSIPPGSDLGCNPTVLPTDGSVQATATASDDRGPITAITVTHTTTTSPSGCTVTLVFTATATGTCGVQNTAMATYTYTANQAPLVLENVPGGGNMGCNPTVPTDYTVTNAVTVDLLCSALETNLTVTHSDSVSGCVTTRTYIITALDNCGNTGTAKVIYSWTSDTTPPVIAGVPTTGLGLGCNPTTLPTVASITGLVSATDDCGGTPAITVTCADTTTGCVTSRTFTITATDTCLNVATQHVTYTWTTDSTPPVITGVPTAGLALGCNPTSLPTVASITALVGATDNCGGTPVISVTCADTTSGCVTSRTFTILATDTCLNVATQYVTYTWTTDTTPPVITGVPTTGLGLGCNPTTIPTVGSITALVGATDNCGGTPAITVTCADATSGCVTSRTFTILATDTCLNVATQYVTYTWTTDTTPPVITGVPTTSLGLGCNPTSLPTVASITALVGATDNCGGTPAITVTCADTTSGCVTSRTFTITATDTCLNVATQHVTYTWTTDSTPPAITGVPTAGLGLGCNPTSLPTVASITALVGATDNCGGTPAITVTCADTTSGCVTSRTFTITATDTCLNVATQYVTYTWTTDTTPPVITGVPTTGLGLGCNPTTIPTVGSITALVGATDNCGGTPAITVTCADATSGCVTSRTFTILATDTCLNVATQYVTYTWTTDTTPPVITGVPTTSLGLGCNPTSLPTVASITALVGATDNCGGTPAITVTCADTTSGCVTSRTFTITATDTCLNVATQHVTYTWTTDSTPPAITGVPTAGLGLGCNPTSLPTVASITALVGATDNCGGTPAITVTCADTTSGCVTSRTFTITATDTCLNVATQYVTYTWTTDTTPPVITGVPTTGLGLGCNPTTIPTVGSITALVGATDNCGGTPAITVTCADATSGCVTSRTFTILATDTCLNVATQYVTYTWTTDTTPPVITGVPTTSLGLGCNPTSLPTVASITALVGATDNCGGTPAITVTCADTTSGCVTSRTFTITATDTCLNVATQHVTYTWTTDSTPPAITGVPTAGLGLGCNPTSLPTVASITALVGATDNCGGTPAITVTCADTTSGCVTSRTFTITATDTCLNVATQHVTYTWTTDSTPPVITGVPTSGLALGCNPTSLPTVGSITALVGATDNCGGTPAISVTSSDATTGCVTSRTFTITATDTCRNVATQHVTFTWTVDTTPPVISNVPTGGSLGNNPGTVPTQTSISNLIRVADACSTPTFSVTNVDVVSACTTTRTFTITATDGCSNHAIATVVYSWTADTGPVVTCPPAVTIATNYAPIYCTFTPGDWNSSCNSANTTPTWWTTWDQQHHGYNCMVSWTNWWNSSTGKNPGANCWNFCQTEQGGNNGNRWWGSSCNANTAPSWCQSWNFGNPNANWWVPCNGYNPGSVLANCFNSVYGSGCVKVGLSTGYCYTFTSCNAVKQCLGFTGSAGSLNGNATNPNSCNAGTFCAQVLALQLNCDFGDAGAGSGFGGPCGDLVLNDPTSPCNGQKVRDICKTANCVLGGGSAPSGCTAAYLCGLCSNLNQCFEGCQVSTWCQSHLTPVCIPPPSVTGTATVATNACTGPAVLTYCDSVATGPCTGSFVITRTWTAVDAAGMSNYCAQTITVTGSPAPSISGQIINDCSGLGCSSGNNNGGWNNWGWNNWGGNSTPSFSGESGLPGVTVALKSSGGATLASTTTDTNGDFSFANPGAGSYTVVVTPPAGYTLTYPTSGTSNQTAVTITSQCQTVCNLLFAYVGTRTSVTLVKTGPATASCGSTITYSFAVTNTGNNCVQLTVIDPLLGGQIFSQNSAAPGQGYTFTETYTVQSSNLGQFTNTAWAVANPAVGPNVTNYSSTVATVTTVPVTCSVTCTPGTLPTSSYIWCNARLSCAPNCNATLYCKNATVTFNCAGGHSYTYPVPDSQICFSQVTSASTGYDGSKWTSTVPCAGDSEIFLAGCGIAPSSQLAHCQSITWTGVFTCDTAGVNCNWQFGTSSYNTDCTQYSSLGVKSCYNVPCNNGSHYVPTDHAGTPENCKTSCTSGGNSTCYISSCGNSGSATCRPNPCQ